MASESGYCRVPDCDHDPQNLSCSRTSGPADGDYMTEMYGQRRTCCVSNHNQWHVRPCLVNGPQGLGSELAGIDYAWPSHETMFSRGRQNGKASFLEYFAEGQTVVKPDLGWVQGPGRIWPVASRLRVSEDNVANDRTFENETRPL